MNDKDIKITLKKWFEFKKKKIQDNDDYFEKNIIDSLEVIHFIEYIENKFKIKLSSEDYQKRNFRTINGIAKIILEKKNEI